MNGPLARLQEWRRARTYRRLLESGQRLASERDDLIARGVDPALLAIPRAPLPPPQDERWDG